MEETRRGDMNDKIGLEERSSIIRRFKCDFVTVHPFTGETIVISPHDWTPEMRLEMEIHLKWWAEFQYKVNSLQQKKP